MKGARLLAGGAPDAFRVAGPGDNFKLCIAERVSRRKVNGASRRKFIGGVTVNGNEKKMPAAAVAPPINKGANRKGEDVGLKCSPSRRGYPVKIDIEQRRIRDMPGPFNPNAIPRERFAEYFRSGPDERGNVGAALFMFADING
jgi:hypothetical protein